MPQTRLWQGKNQVNYNNRSKGENQIIIFIDAEKMFERIEHIPDAIVNKIRINGYLLHMEKRILSTQKLARCLMGSTISGFTTVTIKMSASSLFIIWFGS